MRFPRLLLCLFLMIGFVVGLPAQPDQLLDFKRPESWAMRYFAAVALMQGNGAPSELKSGQFALGFEVAHIPTLSLEKRTVGFNGTKEENLNKSPVLARPLIHYGLSDRFSLTATYVPPVEIFTRLRTHSAALALQAKLVENDYYRLNLRVAGQWTEAVGDFTSPAETAGDPDPERNPFGLAEPSSDTFTSLSSTVELAFEYKLPIERAAHLFVNGAFTYADLDFEVDALYMSGVHDNRHLMTNGNIWSFGVGGAVQISPSVWLSASIVHVPLRVRRPPDFELRNDSLTHFRMVINVLL